MLSGNRYNLLHERRVAGKEVPRRPRQVATGGGEGGTPTAPAGGPAGFDGRVAGKEVLRRPRGVTVNCV